MTFPKKIIESNHNHVEAVPTDTTTRIVQNGLRGCEPLPVTDLPWGGVATAWLPSNRALKALKRGDHGLVLVILDNGEMSMTVQKIEIIKSN